MLDWTVAVLATLLAEAEVAVRYGHDPRRALLMGLGGLSLLGLRWWRRLPVLAMAALGLQGLITVAGGGAPTTLPILAIFVVSFGLGAYAGWRQLFAGALIPPVLVTVIDTLRPSPYPLPEAVAYFALFEVGAPVLVGRLVRARADLVAQLRERRAELEREHAGAAAAARAAERLALGRKLDELVIAGVEALIKDAGEESKAAAVRIETRARSLLEEMRSLLQELSSPV